MISYHSAQDRSLPLAGKAIRRIREKIEINPGEPEYLKVVWGIGYKIEKH